jgi:hypothetical protein
MAIPARPVDTTADAARVQVDMLRCAPIPRRLHLAFSLSAAVITLARQGIERAQPHVSVLGRDIRFVEVHYGSEVAAGLRADLVRRQRTPRE